MNNFDLLEALNEVDDEYIRSAKEVQTGRKRVWRAVGALAACAALVLSIPVAVNLLGLNDAKGGSAISPGEVAREYGNVSIYYVEEGQILSKEAYLELSPMEIFAAWRDANKIGDEVAFFGAKVETNGQSVDLGNGHFQTEIGEYFALRITISQKIENYYGDEQEKTLLLEGLRLTMTGYSTITFDEYALKLI